MSSVSNYWWDLFKEGCIPVTSSWDIPGIAHFPMTWVKIWKSLAHLSKYKVRLSFPPYIKPKYLSAWMFCKKTSPSFNIQYSIAPINLFQINCLALHRGVKCPHIDIWGNCSTIIMIFLFLDLSAVTRSITTSSFPIERKTTPSSFENYRPSTKGKQKVEYTLKQTRVLLKMYITKSVNQP